MSHIFISYSRKDLTFVKLLAADLKQAGFEVWYDVSRIAGGSSWRSEIESAIRNSQFQIVVLSPDSIASKWVEREFLFASRLNLKIIPLMYRPCELPMNYLDTNYIDVEGDNYGRNFHEILRALGKAAETSVVPLESPLEPLIVPANQNRNAKSILPITIGALIILFLAASSYLLIQWLQQASHPITEPVTVIPNTITPEPPTAVPLTDIIDNFGVEMVLIPAGVFSMGSDNGEDDEKPPHAVSVPSFYLDKNEVTNKLYKACVDAGECMAPQTLSSATRPNYFGNPEFDDYPVIFVNWAQAKAYCAWRGALLPAEAQWEKAARGTTGYVYPWGNEIDVRFANYNGSFRRDTTRVASYEQGKSMYGVYDMVGNVWEWVSSLYMPYPYRVDERENPNTSGARVVRGGSWYDHTAGLRSSDRYGNGPEDANDGLGFRCAREAFP